MKKNKLKQLLKDGRYGIGTFVKMYDPSVVEVLALAGFDFFVLDNEHVAMDREQLLHILRAAEAYDITPIVRVKENNQVEILQNLDLGYAGIQVPNVDTPQQARRLAASAKYTPVGIRGLSPSVRACNYASDSVKEYIEEANAQTMVISHCETKTCMDNLEEILKVDGVDVIFIGPMDLSQSLGMPGDTGNPVVKKSIADVMGKVRGSGKAIGTVAGSPKEVKNLIEQGVQYILLSSDQGMIMKWAKAALAEIRDTV